MNAPLPEPLAPYGVVGILLIAFPLIVWVLQGACYFCRLEVPSFTKGSLVMLALYITNYAAHEMLGIEPTGKQYVVSLTISTGLAVVIQSLMLNLSLFDSLRVQVASWLLAMTGGVVVVLAMVGGAMLLHSNGNAGTPPAASVPGGMDGEALSVQETSGDSPHATPMRFRP